MFLISPAGILGAHLTTPGSLLRCLLGFTQGRGLVCPPQCSLYLSSHTSPPKSICHPFWPFPAPMWQAREGDRSCGEPQWGAGATVFLQWSHCKDKENMGQEKQRARVERSGRGDGQHLRDLGKEEDGKEEMERSGMEEDLCVSACSSVCPPTHVPVIHLSIHLFIDPPIYLPIHPSTCLSVHPPT